ncbi:prepro-carboxypeptidase Z [Mucor mucedo]|uniref:prepro-carboxypeptidase Z n=1 Tax=Mucor mucedo TaxID=29922 RepID=UPI00221FC149|nr:prepro-carboxypeptidase Z [Mucor mucedo]KAI7895973.1 prepro-carboxypeptidase Z [Mucor mucedo]
MAVACIVHGGNAASTYEPIDYKVIQSSNHPNYSVRFVNPNLCDPNVTQYSGYLDMGPNNHYFFWFFESKSNPDARPLTAWLNGGPGCSSMIGLWQENGPCRSHGDGTEIGYNANTWTHFSNMLFIDQPNGVGYSYGDPLQFNVEQGATQFYEALQLFYEVFPKYREVPFHLFGESFAGRYIPHYADYIVKQNQLLQGVVNPRGKEIPIDSVGIGNGWINPLIQFKHAAGMACDSSYGPLVSSDVCEQMKGNYPTCAKLIERCYETDEQYACVAADRYCTENIDLLFQTSGLNYYDVRKGSREIDPPEDYVRILNNPEFQQAIGVESLKFEQCAERPYDAMSRSGEGARDSSPALASLLNNGVRVLNYVGDADYLCNWYGNYETMEQLRFNGSSEYNKQSLKPWIYRGREVGQMKGTNRLTFIRVYNAGHEVPYYQPQNALAMFYTWIFKKEF